MKLPLYIHNKFIYSSLVPTKYDWYLILADAEHIRYVEEIIVSTPEGYRVAIITGAPVTNKYRLLADLKCIYLLELDIRSFEGNALEKIFDKFFIPPGVGCLQVKASSKVSEIIKNGIVCKNKIFDCY